MFTSISRRPDKTLEQILDEEVEIVLTETDTFEVFNMRSLVVSLDDKDQYAAVA